MYFAICASHNLSVIRVSQLAALSRDKSGRSSAYSRLFTWIYVKTGVACSTSKIKASVFADNPPCFISHQTLVNAFSNNGKCCACAVLLKSAFSRKSSVHLPAMLLDLQSTLTLTQTLIQTGSTSLAIVTPSNSL